MKLTQVMKMKNETKPTPGIIIKYLNPASNCVNGDASTNNQRYLPENGH